MIEREKFGAVLRAAREHRGESQDEVAARAGGIERAKIAQVELGLNQASTARVRDIIAAGWALPRSVVDALVEGRLDAGTAALALNVPVEVVAGAVERGVARGRGWAPLPSEAP